MTTVDATIDPRLEARRVAVAAASHRRRVRLLAWCLAPLLAAAAAWALTYSAALDIDRVRVTGADVTADDEIVAAGALATGGRMAGLDEALAERRIEALPWVADADVRRAWPGTVDVEVIERVPALAVTREDGRVALVDAEGLVLAVRDVAPADLVVASGLMSSAAPGAVDDAGVGAVAAVTGGLGDPVREQVLAARHAPSGVELDLHGGGVVVAGDADRAAEKAAAVAAVLAVVSPSCIERLDVTIPAAPTLVRASGC